MSPAAGNDSAPKSLDSEGDIGASEVDEVLAAPASAWLREPSSQNAALLGAAIEELIDSQGSIANPGAPASEQVFVNDSLSAPLERILSNLDDGTRLYSDIAGDLRELGITLPPQVPLGGGLVGEDFPPGIYVTYRPIRSVRGHEKVPAGGQLRSPLVATRSPRWWPGEVPAPR